MYVVWFVAVVVVVFVNDVFVLSDAQYESLMSLRRAVPREEALSTLRYDIFIGVSHDLWGHVFFFRVPTSFLGYHIFFQGTNVFFRVPISFSRERERFLPSLWHKYSKLVFCNHGNL